MFLHFKDVFVDQFFLVIVHIREKASAYALLGDVQNPEPGRNTKVLFLSGDGYVQLDLVMVIYGKSAVRKGKSLGTDVDQSHDLFFKNK